jgi:hypothetical protein
MPERVYSENCMKRPLLLTGILLVILSACNAQKNDAEDSASASSGTIYTGLSNGYFSPKSSSSSISQLNWNFGASYSHKSGLGIAISSYMTKDKNVNKIYQTAITPSYDYNLSATWGGGISYTHYFTADSVSFDLSPLKNELYGYLNYKKFFLSPTLAVNYAYGTEKDVLQTQRRTITKSVSVHDIDFLFSVSHAFDIGSVFSGNDGFTITPTALVMYGTNTYGANIIGGKLPRFTSNKRAAKLAQALATPANTAAWQYFTFTCNFSYSIGKFYIEPELVLDYTIPKAESQWNQLFIVTAGVNF